MILFDHNVSKEKILKECFYQGHPNFKGPVFFGTANGNLEKCYELKRKGIDFAYIDMPYFDKTRVHFVGDLNKSQFRVCFNSVFLNKIYSVPSDRFEKLNIKIEDWKKSGDEIIFFYGSSTTNFFFSNNKEIESILDNIKRIYPNKRIVKSKKTSSRLVVNLISIREQVKNCFFTVSIVSMASIQAILMGVPCFCHEESPCFPVSGYFKGNFKNINYSEKRYDWCKTLSYGQFTLEEISKGIPLIFYKEYFSDLL